MDDEKEKQLFDNLAKAKTRLSRHSGYLLDQQISVRQQIEELESQLKILYLSLELKENEITTKEDRLIQLYDLQAELPDKLSRARTQFENDYENVLIDELRNLAKEKADGERRLKEIEEQKKNRSRNFPWKKGEKDGHN